MVSNVFVETIDNDNEVVALAQHEMNFLLQIIQNYKINMLMTITLFIFSFTVTTYKFLKLHYYLRAVQDPYCTFFTSES